jgi:hypothetical protein
LKTGEVREGGTAWNILKNFALLWTVAMAIVAISGLMAASSNTANLRSDAERAGAAIGTALGLGVIGALWFFPMVGSVLLGFILKKSSVVEKGPSGPLAGEGTQLGNIGGKAWVGIVALSLIGLWALAKLGPQTGLNRQAGTGTQRQVSEEETSASTPQLALISSRGYQTESGGYYIVEGQVQNISGNNLKDIEAVASWYAADGTFITSDSAIIEYNPLLPGQTSPFRTMSTANPAMAKYTVEFKSLFGPTIGTVDRRKAK